MCWLHRAGLLLSWESTCFATEQCQLPPSNESASMTPVTGPACELSPAVPWQTNVAKDSPATSEATKLDHVNFVAIRSIDYL